MIVLEEIKGSLPPGTRLLYKCAFPANERKPVAILYRTRHLGSGTLFCVKDPVTNKRVGLAFILTDGKMILLDYLAVNKKLRSKGYGSDILEALQKKFPDKTIIIEIETADEKAKNNPQRIKRKNFYLRNGLQESGIIIRLFGVEMELLHFGSKFSFDEYYSMLETAFGPGTKEMIKKNVLFIRKTEK